MGRVEIKFNQMQVLEERGNRTTRVRNLSEKKREPSNLTHITTPGLEIEHGPHWWDASGLTTTPPLLSLIKLGQYHKHSSWSI